MAENVGAQIVRDTALEQRMLEAVIADRNDHPRNKQRGVGPSSIGFCRELLRAMIFEEANQNEAQETHWATAAHVGTVMGADLERIFGRRLGALEQQRVTATLTDLGVQLSGAIDLLFVDEDYVTDLKSSTDIGSVLYDANRNATIIETLLSIWREGRLFEHYVETPDGGYELTQVMLSKFAKLHYYVQVALYVTGAVQMGILPSSAEGRLVYYDRSGDFQEFVALVISAEEIAMFFDIGQHRVAQVVRAQDLFEQTGNPALIHQLRDQPPSFCFSPKVMCVQRLNCWGGSDWESSDLLDSAEVSSAIGRYVEGRRLAKLGDGMKQAARSELKGISGRTPDGDMVTWSGNTINVVERAMPKVEVTMPRVETASGEVLAEGDGADAGVLVLPDELATQWVEPLDPADIPLDAIRHRTPPRSLEEREQTEWPDHEGRDGNAPVPPLPKFGDPEMPFDGGVDALGLPEQDGGPAAVRRLTAEQDRANPHRAGTAIAWDHDNNPAHKCRLEQKPSVGGPVHVDSNGDTHGESDDSDYYGDEGDLTAQQGPEFADPPERDPRLDRVQFVEDESDYTYAWQGAPEASQSILVTPPQQILDANPDLTPGQRAYLERHAQEQRTAQMQADVAAGRRERHGA